MKYSLNKIIISNNPCNVKSSILVENIVIFEVATFNISKMNINNNNETLEMLFRKTVELIAA